MNNKNGLMVRKYQINVQATPKLFDDIFAYYNYLQCPNASIITIFIKMEMRCLLFFAKLFTIDVIAG